MVKTSRWTKNFFIKQIKKIKGYTLNECKNQHLFKV